MKIVFNRSRLLTGHALKLMDESMLQEPSTGLQCCLGQALAQFGVPEKSLIGCHSPDRFELGGGVLPTELEWFLSGADPTPGPWRNSCAANRAMSANDDADMAAEQREARISEVFHQQGFEVEWTGDYSDGVSLARQAQAARRSLQQWESEQENPSIDVA